MKEVIEKLIKMTKDGDLFWYLDYTNNMVAQYGNVLFELEYGDLWVGGVLFQEVQYPYIKDLNDIAYEAINIREYIDIKTVDTAIETILSW